MTVTRSRVTSDHALPLEERRFAVINSVLLSSLPVFYVHCGGYIKALRLLCPAVVGEGRLRS